MSTFEMYSSLLRYLASVERLPKSHDGTQKKITLSMASF